MKKEPHFISGKLLEALGGQKKETQVGSLVDKGAYLWGVEDKEKGAGILRHVLLVSRVADALAQELLSRKVRGYENLERQSVVEAAILHDAGKLYGEDREKLSAEQKKILGLDPDFSEFSDEVDETVVSWLRELGFSTEVGRAISKHDMPLDVVDDPYWKIVLVSDYMATSRQIMPVEDRLAEIRRRWMYNANQEGRRPKVDRDRFERGSVIVKKVAGEIFSSLQTTDAEFVERNKLNDSASIRRWEKFVLGAALNKREHRALQLVKRLVDGLSN